MVSPRGFSHPGTARTEYPMITRPNRDHSLVASMIAPSCESREVPTSPASYPNSKHVLLVLWVPVVETEQKCLYVLADCRQF